jgi:hypothetical protein
MRQEQGQRPSAPPGFERRLQVGLASVKQCATARRGDMGGEGEIVEADET